jgi:hypothetical protein
LWRTNWAILCRIRVGAGGLIPSIRVRTRVLRRCNFASEIRGGANERCG